MTPSSDRVLFVSEQFPYPPVDGGSMRSYQVLRHLAARRPVTLVALAPQNPGHDSPDSPDSSIAGIADLGVEVLTVPRPAGRRSRLAGPAYAARALVGSRPYPLNKNFSRAVLRQVERELAAGGVGTLHLNHLDAAQYVDFLPASLFLPGARGRVRTVLDTHNVLTPLYGRLAAAERRPWARLYVDLQRRKMERFERALLARLDRCLVCSEQEAALLAGWGIGHVTVVPNGVDTGYFRPAGARPAGPAADGRSGTRLLFTGAMDYRPNEDGAEWFLDAVWPALCARLPGAAWTIAGKNPSQALRQKAEPQGVELTGFVDDIRPWFERAEVFVVPLRIGGGTRLKILEAMAMGLPVVSTRVGAEGIEARDGEEIVLADTPAEMVEALAALAGDAARRAELGRRGRALVERRYDWSSVLEPVIGA
jgi:polysaccharide biosynthesis protein PslH